MNCDFKTIEQQTSHLSKVEAIKIGASAAIEQQLEGVVLQYRPDVEKPRAPRPTVKLVNLKVFHGIRSDNAKIDTGIPGFPGIFVLKSA